MEIEKKFFAKKKCENCHIHIPTDYNNLCNHCYKRLRREEQIKSGTKCKKCLIKPVYAKNFCNACYQRLKKEEQIKSGIKCKKCLIKPVYAKNLCCACYSAIRNSKIYLEKNCERCGNSGVFRKNRCKSCYHSRYLNKNTSYDIPIRKKSKNGQGTINSYGYKILTMKNPLNLSKTGKIAEHIVVMSKFLKRPLFKHETVHHKNGIRNDNRIENLELWSVSHPKGQRVEDKIKWAKEFLKLYE